MPHELITQDLASHLATPEAAEVLRAFESANANGGTPTISLFNGSMMKRFGRNIAMLEWIDRDSLRVLYTGPEVPDDDGRPIAGQPLAHIHPNSARFYQQGAEAARGRDTVVMMRHRGCYGSAVHRWEALFLPLAERAGAERTLVAVVCMPLEHKHSFLRAILDAMPQAALVVSPLPGDKGLTGARVQAANRAATHLLGHPDLDALFERDLATAFAEPDVENAWGQLVAEMQPGLSARFDYNHRCESGARWFDVQVTPLGSGIMIALADITDLKRAILDLEHQRKMLVEEMEQRRSLEEELWALAHLDPLTGLPNRRAFREDAQTTLIASQTLGRPCAIIAIDIDHFKRVNDTYGHGAGDVVLRRVADILKAPLRPEVDIAARLGGEEFTVLLPETELSGARAFAEMLRHRVEHTLVIVGDAEIRPTISLGVAMVNPEGDLDNLIDRSDRALYAAKRAGRNRVMAEGDISEDNQEEAA